MTFLTCQDPSSVVGTDIFPNSIVGAINSHMVRHPHMPLGIDSVVGHWHLPYQANMVKPPTCLWASIVWQAPTSAIPEEDDTTSHVHLTLNSIVGAYHHLVPAGVGNKT